MTADALLSDVGEASPDALAAQIQSYNDQVISTLGPNGIDVASLPPAPWANAASLGPKELAGLTADVPEAPPPATAQTEKFDVDPSNFDADPPRKFPGWDADPAELIAWGDDALNRKPQTAEDASFFEEKYEEGKQALIKLGVNKAKGYIADLLKDGLKYVLEEGISYYGPAGAAAAASSAAAGGFLDKVKDIASSITDPSKLLSLGFEYGLPAATGAGIDAFFKSVWKVDDSSSMADQLAHRYAEQLVKAIVDELLSNVKSLGDLIKNFGNLKDNLLKKIKERFEGAESTAVLKLARSTDMHTCPMVTGIVPHVGGPILPPCCPTVLGIGLPSARIADLVTCVGPPDIIARGAATVLIGGVPASRLTDITSHGGVITTPGAPTVLVGDPSVTIVIKPDAAHPNFASDVQKALAKILPTKSGAEWLRQMGKNGKSVTIVPFDTANGSCTPSNPVNAANGIGSDSVIEWNPNHNVTDAGLPGAQGSPGAPVILAHEMVHAMHNGNGNQGQGPWDHFPNQNGSSNRTEERSTVGTDGSPITIPNPSPPPATTVQNNPPDYSKGNPPGTPTENSFRDDLGIPRRPSYYPSNWPGGPPW